MTRTFLFLLLLMGTSMAIWDWNATTVNIINITANVSAQQTNQSYGIVTVNLTPFAGDFNADCSNFQLTLNSSGNEVLTRFNISGNSDSGPHGWTACKPEVYVTFITNMTEPNNTLMAIGYITNDAVINPPITIYYDHLSNNISKFICGNTGSIDSSLSAIKFTAEDPTSSYCYFNATLNNATFSVRQYATAMQYGLANLFIYGRWNSTALVATPKAASSTYIYGNKTDGEGGIGSNVIHTPEHGNSTAPSLVNQYGKWYVKFGSIVQLYSETNSTAVISAEDIGNLNPLNTIFGFSVSDGGGIEAEIDEYALVFAPDDETIYGYSYNWSPKNSYSYSGSGYTLNTFILSPLNSTYNSTALNLIVTANSSNASYSCNYTLNGITNATNFTVVNNTNYSASWTLPLGGYNLWATCSNDTYTSTASVIFASRQLLGWINTTNGTSFYASSGNFSNCTANIYGSPQWVNFTVTNASGTKFIDNQNGTPMNDGGNWSSRGFVPANIGVWTCSVSVFDGTSIITNSTTFSVNGATPPAISGITTTRGLSFDFVATNDTNCTATVTDPDGDNTIQWVNFTISNPVGTAIVSNINGTVTGTTWASRNFIAGTVGVWTCYITTYDGLNQPIGSQTFSVTVPAGGDGGGGGGGTIIINGTTPEEPPFELPPVTGGEAFLQIVAIAAVILFILASQQK